MADTSTRALIVETLAEHLLEGLQVIDSEYRYLYVNEAVAKHGRTTRDALIGRTMMEAYPGIERTEMFSVLRHVLEERDAATMENEFLFPDGSTGWFELRMTPVPEGVAILSVDITERKHTELELGRVMRALETLSRTNHALVRADDEARFMDEVCRIMVEEAGYHSAWIGLVDPHDDARVRVAARRTAAGTEDGTLDADLDDEEATLPVRALRDGRAMLDREQGSASGDTEGPTLALPLFGESECIGVLVVRAREREAFDDRERLVLDEVALDLGFGLATLHGRATRDANMAALELARMRLRAVHDALPNPVLRWQARPAGFALVHVNQAARDLFGRRAHDQIPATLPDLQADVDRCAKEGLPITREVRARLAGGARERQLRVSCGFLPPNEVLTHIHDVTHQRETEAQLRAAQRLEEIGRLAGGIAHDFNNLLSVIASYASFALETMNPDTTPYADIVEVQSAAARAGTLTRQLLAFSRRQVIEPVVTNWTPIVEGLERMMRRLLGESIEIVVRSPKSLGNVRADPGQLEQVLINLLVNARDAMPNGGNLTVELSDVALDADQASAIGGLEAGDYVMLAVSDTGIGMDDVTKAKLFEPFFTTKGPGKGSGLGLSTVYGIVRQHDGAIWLWSQRERGTTFKVYLPRCDAAVGPTKPTRTLQEQGDETILLVEDDDGVRAAASRILRTSGYSVLDAARVVDAKDIASRESIDLVLTDIMLPDGTGVDLARWIRDQHSPTKVLFMSGYSGDDIELEPGARFIAKPFSGADVRAKVREVLDLG